VDDIIEALLLIMYKDYYGYDFELGRGKNISVNEVAAMMNIKPVYKDPKPGEARHTLNDNLDAKVMLGWEPERELEDYLKEVLG
jgi:UDP-glucose 4-epimerase